MKYLSAIWMAGLCSLTACAQQKAAPQQVSQTAAATATESQFTPGALWYDESGELINAHGGGLLYEKGTYYWFGEKRAQHASLGVNVYSSTDLYHWKSAGLALAPAEKDTTSEIALGCLMERPKVIYNKKTGKYVLWFHLELRGKGYSAARAGVAVSDHIAGPYTYLGSFRPNGNMARDMTVYTDSDDKAYLVYSSRENYDMRLVQLTDDYLAPTTQDVMLFSQHREAPAMFKYKDTYYLITSGCTGWAPNKASVHTATNIWGPWKELPENPMEGPEANTTFGGQSAYVLPLEGKAGEFIFIADKWNPRNIKDSRYLWLPISFEKGIPVVKWHNSWTLDYFDKQQAE